MCKVLEDMRYKALQEGIKEGEKANMRTTALRMLKAKKYTLDEIVVISGLSLDEVKELSAGKAL